MSFKREIEEDFMNTDRSSIYKRYVDVIKEVVNIEIDVIYNSHTANCSGSPYAGFGEYSLTIAPDLHLYAEFDLLDFLEPEHIKYFHIGLPQNIYDEKKHSYLKQSIKDLLAKDGIRFTVDNAELFIILHEFGHVNQLITEFNKDVVAYTAYTCREHSSVEYELKFDGLLGTKEGNRKYRNIPSEKYADAFAVNHIKNVMKVLTSKQF